MATYQARNNIKAVQWYPDDKQSFERIKVLIESNSGLGWRVNKDDILGSIIIVRNCLNQRVLQISPYDYLVEGKRNSLFVVRPEMFELFYEKMSDTVYQKK